MNIKLVDNIKKYENDINLMVTDQWNSSFIYNNSVLGKVALAGNEFAGACYGWPKEDYFYLDTICILDKYQHQGIGTKLLDSVINKVKSISHGGGAYKGLLVR